MIYGKHCHIKQFVALVKPKYLRDFTVNVTKMHNGVKKDTFNIPEPLTITTLFGLCEDVVEKNWWIAKLK